MDRPLRKYILILVLIFLLPTVFFSVYEIGTLRQNEQVIEQIYNNQLDAILFSINQYADDVISNWADRAESCLVRDTRQSDSCLHDLMGELPSVSSIWLVSRKEDNPFQMIAGKEKEDILPALKKSLPASDTLLLIRLQQYLDEEGYRKIVPLPLNAEKSLFLFAIERETDCCFMLLVQTPRKFIEEVLDPRIQQVASEKFNIAVLKTKTDTQIYSSARTSSAHEFKLRRSFWLLPEYSMGIELMDTTINDLVQSRSKRNLLLMGLIDFVLLLGIWLLYWNVKKQTELSQLKSDFVSNVSHEIRTPLALITMYIETLEMGRLKSKEKVQEYYRVIQQETRRLTAIVNKILSFSQIESGKRTYSFESLDLNEIVREVINTYAIRLQKDGFVYQVNMEEDLPRIHGDGEAVTDALINLIDNAVKYSDTEKFIELSTSHKGNHVLLSVRDQGIGISEHDQKHIFDKFYRVTEKNLALKAKGSGLGLAIVKHIIDAHEGTISLESKKGKGTQFTLHFPVK